MLHLVCSVTVVFLHNHHPPPKQNQTGGKDLAFRDRDHSMVQVSNKWTDDILSAFNGAEELAKVPISTLGLCAVDSPSP